MTTQPEALRLAEIFESDFDPDWMLEFGYDEAAAELRRLHEAHDWQYRMAGERLRRIEKLEAQHDALLEALKCLLSGVFDGPDESDAAYIVDKARAAIAKAEDQA